jgi:hypothetical protein
MRHMAVDRYLKSNRRFAENESYPDMTALYQALDRDEYDIIYGIDDSEFSLSLSKKANSKIQSNPDKINIIYECSCNHPRKHRHHPNYDEPYTVLLLCPSCHRKEHARLHRWHEPAYELLADQSATNSTTPAVNAPAEDRLDGSQHHETETSYWEFAPCANDDRRAVAVTAELESRKCFSISLPRDGRTDTAALAINR